MGIRFFLVAVVVTCLCVRGVAQVDRAGLAGTVKDSANRNIPAVTVLATQLATGQRFRTVTSASGIYDLPELPIGAYRVTYSAQGFQEKIVDAVEQTVGHTRTLDVVLSVAGAVEHVEVSDVGDQFDRTLQIRWARASSRSR